VRIRILPGDAITVSRADLANAIRRGVTDQFVQRVEAFASIDDFVPIEALAGLGITLRFDQAELELLATFDPSAFPERRIGLGFDTAATEAQPDQSANFAAFLSYQGSLDWIHSGFDPGFRKPRINFLVNGRLLRTIGFENDFTYDGNEDKPFTRFASRALFDLPSRALRFSAGDLIPVTSALQEQVDVGGLGLSKLLSTFQSDRVFTASAGRKLTLREPATVTIIVNGAPSRTLRLTPGTYDIQDLPLTGGANLVELVIEDDAGGRRLISFDFFEDVLLLAPGVDEFDIKAGLRSDVDERGRYYFRHDPVVSGFYRRGLTNKLTLGINVQASRRAVQLGGEITYGSPIGLFTLEGSASRLDDFGTGAAARLQYRYSAPMRTLVGNRRLDILGEYRSAYFGGIDGPPNNPYSVSISTRYSQPITDQLSAGAGVDYRRGRFDTPNFKAIRADASYRLRDNISLTGSVGYESRSGAIFGASLFWRLGRQSLATARYDSRSNSASIAYFHTPERLLDTVSWGVEGTHSDGGRFGLNGTAIYRTNRGDFEVAHRTTFASDDLPRDQVTSLRARGTIAFADAQFAIGRYLTNSFAIIEPHDTLDGAQILIGNKISADAEARSGALGPALVALGSYSNRTVYYTVPDAPVGYDFGTGTLELYPWEHSGFRRTIGSEFNVSITGRLVDQRGNPVALAIGQATRIGDTKSPAIEVFTNRDGRLGASGLAPGDWLIKAGDLEYRLTIAPDDGALININDLRPTSTGEK
jgi:outer membrane usher protein